MIFQQALLELKDGKSIKREDWDDYSFYRYLWVDKDYENDVDFLKAHDKDNNDNAPLLTINDFLAEDWEVCYF